MTLDKIDHIVFLMLENRSFDHMLGYLSLDETPKPMAALDGLRSSKAWRDSFANKGDDTLYRIKRLGSNRSEIDDPPHGKARILQQIDTPPAGPGPTHMGGFVQAYIDSRTKAVDKKTGKPKPRPKPKRPGDVMGYYDSDGVPTYDFLARNFCVCERWFASLPLGTQANRLMAMGGESSITDNKGIGNFPNQKLVYDWLDDNKIKWRTYTWGGFVPFFTLMKRYRGRIAGSILTGDGEFRPYTRFRKHWQDNDKSKKFPSVVFIEPEYEDAPGPRSNDDHPPAGVAGGQALVADIYNTLISNPERWEKTLLIVTYDEHGGFFDHVAPPRIDSIAGGETFPTTGPRVPALLVSPCVGKGSIFSEELDHTSFLQLLSDRFTPKSDYSRPVADRQKLIKGRIANALGEPRKEAWRPIRPVETKSLGGAAPDWISRKLKLRAPATRNGVALDKALRDMFTEYPKLAEHPDAGEMTLYVAITEPPSVERDDYIE
jgi:phospholipase C